MDCMVGLMLLFCNRIMILVACVLCKLYKVWLACLQTLGAANGCTRNDRVVYKSLRSSRYVDVRETLSSKDRPNVTGVVEMKNWNEIFGEASAGWR